MAFDKRDYLFDDGLEDGFIEFASEANAEHQREHTTFLPGSRADWVIDLLNDLQKTARELGTPLFDRCNTQDFTSFVGRYNKRARN